MKPIKRTLSIAAICGLMPVLAQAEVPEVVGALPGQAVTVPWGGSSSNSGDLAFNFPTSSRDRDFYCFRNDHGFSWMDLTIATTDLDSDDYIAVTLYDHNFNVIQAEQFREGETQTILVFPRNGSSWYVSFVDDGTMDEDGAYQFQLKGVGGTDPAVEEAAVASTLAAYNQANKNYKKWKKRYKKLKKDKKKRKTKSGKKKLKKYKKKYKKYKKRRDSYRRPLAAL